MHQTVRGLLYSDPILSPVEQMFWIAFNCIEPYGNEIKALAFLEAGVRQIKDPKKLFPPECLLDNPLSGVDLDTQRKIVREQMTAFASEFISSP